MNHHEIWLAGFTILSIISNRRISSQIDYTNFCYVDNSVEGMKTLNCSTLNPKNIYTSVTLPTGDDKASLKVIYLAPIEVDKQSTINLMSIAFHEYPNLKRVIIRNNVLIKTAIPTYDFKMAYTVYYRPTLEKTFEDCNNLEILEISSSFFYDAVQFKLPQNLKIYNVAKNLYKILKIHGSDELIEVNASSNPLVNIPLFSDPLPPLKTLRLKGCPLQDMTILDLAPLCELSLLELELPEGNRLRNSEGYCNCTILKEYAEDVSLQINSVKCYEPKSTEKISCSKSDYLDKARFIRKKCPLLKKGALSKTIISVLMYVFFSIIFLLLLASVILYVIRHYHLKEWWREHHLRMSQASSVNMEEAEESLRDQSSTYDEG